MSHSMFQEAPQMCGLAFVCREISEFKMLHYNVHYFRILLLFQRKSCIYVCTYDLEIHSHCTGCSK